MTGQRAAAVPMKPLIVHRATVTVAQLVDELSPQAAERLLQVEQTQRLIAEHIGAHRLLYQLGLRPAHEFPEAIIPTLSRPTVAQKEMPCVS